MKRSLTIFLGAMASLLIVAPLNAGFSDLEIHVQPKQIKQSGVQAQAGGSRFHSQEQWAYDVTVENKSFKPLEGLELRYVVFSKHEKFGSTDPAETKRANGSLTIGSLKPHEKKSFTTNSVEIDKTQLDGDYYFPSGGKQKAQDSLVGCWVRVYQNGQQIAEYANPSTLLREHWD